MICTSKEKKNIDHTNKLIPLAVRYVWIPLFFILVAVWN